MGKKDMAKRDAEPKTTNAELSEDELEDVSGGLQVEMTNVIIASYSHGSPNSGLVAEDEITLKCGNVRTTRKE